MLNKNFNSFFKKDPFIFYTSILNFSFFFYNLYKYNILNLLLIFRFSQFSKTYFLTYAEFFVADVDLKKNRIIFSSDYVVNNNIQNFFNIFSSFSNTKKNILKSVALKKKSNLFKKYDSYKRTVFFSSYTDIKDSYIVNTKKSRFFYIFKNNSLDEPLDTVFSRGKNCNNILDKFSQANYFFFKKFFLNRQALPSSFFLQKKRLLYRMHKRFNLRYYANRLIFKHVFLPEKSRQFTITRFIENFKTHASHNFYKQVQLFLFSTLLSSQFFFFKSDCFFFLKHYGVFVNGKLCTNPYKILVQGDVVQLPIIDTYYFFFKKFDNISHIFFKKYSAKLQRMFSSKKKRFRTKSRHLPKWISNVSYLHGDIPSYLEVDFTIMSIIIIYNCDSLYDVHTAVSDHVLLYLYRTYNWRKLA